MATGSFRLMVRQGIKPEGLGEFEKLAAEFSAGVQANEPDTLAYEWFVDLEGSCCYLNEFYRDSDAFLLHFETIGPKLGAMLEISPLEEMIVLGEPDQRVREMLTGMGAKFYSLRAGFAR